MGLAGDQAGELLQDVGALRSRVDRVRGCQGRKLIVFLAPAFHAIATLEPRDVGGAAGRQRAVYLPQHRPVDERRVGVRCRGFAREPATHDASGVELRRDHQAARQIDADTQFLQDNRGQ